MKINKRQKLIILPIILVLIGGLFIVDLNFATLYGGSNIDSVGGETTYSDTSLSGNQIINLPQTFDASQVDITISNSGGASKIINDVSFFEYRELTIDNTGGVEIVDYPFSYTSTYNALMQTDMDDICFALSDDTILPHYTSSVTDSTSAEIYIKISVPADSTLTFREYYGNPTTDSLSDGYNTFSFFENFESTEIGSIPTDWSTVIGNYNVDEYVEVQIDDTGDNTNVLRTYTQQNGAWSAAQYTYGKYISTLPTGNYKLEYDVRDNRANTASYYKVYVTANGVTLKIIPATDTTWQHESYDITDIGELRFGQWTYMHTASHDVRYDNILIRKYDATVPSITVGSSHNFTGVEMTTSCTGDSDTSSFENPEEKTISLNPNESISQINIDSNSANYDYSVIVKWSETISNVDETVNNTTAMKTLTFTPSENISNGFLNANFTEITFSEWQIDSINATLDDVELLNATIDQNTVSVEFDSANTSEHIGIFTIQYSEKPVIVPSSSGGGGGSISIPVIEEIVEENNTEVVNSVSEQLDKNEVVNILSDKFQTSSILIIFVLFTIVFYLFYKGRN